MRNAFKSSRRLVQSGAKQLERVPTPEEFAMYGAQPPELISELFIVTDLALAAFSCSMTVPAWVMLAFVLMLIGSCSACLASRNFEELRHGGALLCFEGLNCRLYVLLLYAEGRKSRA